MKISARILILFSLLISMGCETLVEEIDNLPTVESKLVVQAFISPQSPFITAIVTESAPFFGENAQQKGPQTIENAIVTISNGATEIQVPFDETEMIYSIESRLFPIEPGVTYYLKVTDGKRTVTSQCTVPKSLVPITDFDVEADIDTILEANQYKNAKIKLKMYWRDVQGEPNFYRVSATVAYSANEIIFDSSSQNERIERMRKNAIFIWDNGLGKSVLQSDINLDGTNMSSPNGSVSIPNYSGYYSFNGQTISYKSDPKLESINMSVLNCDEPYYKYHRSLEYAGESNPFIEPSLVYTNIEGGLGCFASYNMSENIVKP